ncbi:MAG TPA: tetratricopeptide repeat protein [Thermoanaerobaculia bacterium]|nr:tetratricopeptide repeat protein [Thermoanaerobaculia bacterium]
MKNRKLTNAVGISFLLLLVNTAYLSAYASATIPYMVNVFLHLLLGVLVAVGAVFLLARRPELRRGFAAAGVLFAVALVLGLYLAIHGNVLAVRGVLWAHIAAAAVGLVALLPWALRQAATGGEGARRWRPLFAGALVLLVAWPGATALYRRSHPNANDRIVNPMVVPASMEQEGGGPKSPFFPSSAKTNVGGIIPSNFFMDSKTCGECHQDIYQQWQSSVHHFGSFNNQFYRKSIEYMQDTVGTQPSKWCAGCHDHAVFFNGRFARPIKQQIDTPEAQAGLACTSCHAIVHVDSSMGNGGFTIEYPPLHELATSKNRAIRAMDHFLTYLNPEPHRRTFMKPFMRADSAEFCSTCHKVHLDVPVNHYRWFRGFNEYDAWQASGVSGQGARSFYYPKETSTCAQCHMPLVDSQDPGNKGGKIHSHRFPGANTAVPYVNRDEAQLAATEAFLKAGVVTVDLFAVSPEPEGAGDTRMVRRAGPADAGPQVNSTFAVGEEAEATGPGFLREVGQVAAPLGVAGAAIQPGSTVRVDAVVRTRKVGHFFPGGTVDAFDVWVELQAKDATGRVIFWSGKVEDDGKGPVEPGAHFYRSYQLDAHGNMINKRNAFQSRSVLYTRLIPPGAADTVHFRMRVPEGAVGPLTVTAKVNYRKFAHYYTQFVYAGQPKPGQDPGLISAHYNNLEYSFDPANIPKNVSGQIKDRIPDLPIVVVAETQTEIALADGKHKETWQPVVRKDDRERWNDWGIGLLLQGDLKGAEYAFLRVTEAEPGYANGWVNVARALIREGETERAKPYLDKALALDPQLASANFFKAQVQKTDGDYDGALASLAKARARFPRDRVVLNQIGRVLFLKREYRKAVDVLEQICLIDPEDVQMHYTLMLAYRGLGDADKVAREAVLFRRFKAEESAQAITGVRRRASPEDNNERQQIHEHESVPLGPATKAVAPPAAKSTREASPVAGGQP